MFRGWSCSWHRCFAILVNFNVNPNTLHEETMFVRKKLLESIELTKLIGKRALKDKVESDDDFPLQLYRLKHEVLCKQKLDRAFYRYERLEGRLLLPKYSHRVRFPHRQDMGIDKFRSCAVFFNKKGVSQMLMYNKS